MTYSTITHTNKTNKHTNKGHQQIYDDSSDLMLYQNYRVNYRMNNRRNHYQQYHHHHQIIVISTARH